MKELGAEIRKAREARGMSVEEVHEKTRIASDRIEMIEAGEWDELPLTYYRSFVRSLGELLDLDGDKLLDAWQTREYEEPKVELDEDLRRISPKNYGSFINLKQPTVFIFAIVAGIVLIALVGVQLCSRFYPAPAEIAADSTAVRPDSLLAGRTIPKEDPFEITIESREDVRIIVRPDRNPGIPVQMKKGRESRWRVWQSLQIMLEKPEPIEIRLNGRTLDYHVGPGAQNPVLKVTREGIEVRSQN